MNRGLARRTIIETRQDARYFLSLLARTCRRGEIEVHSYALMLTHFHLLVRSVRGELSNAMRWVQNLYVRRFNRMRRRDGPLMRGRFLSIPVSTSIYLRTVVRYNDQNPVDAGLVARPADYPHGSAQWLRQDGRGPPWLSRSLIDGLIEGYAPRMGARADAYDRVFSPRLTTRQRAWIKKRLEGKARGFDDLDNLLDGAETVSDWVRRKAMLADGTEPGVCLVDAETAEDVLLDALPDLGTIDTCPSGRLRPAAPLMRAALPVSVKVVAASRHVSRPPQSRSRQCPLQG